MATFEQFKSVIGILPLPQETKDLFISSSDTMLDFRNFIADKYGITPSEADEKIARDLNPGNTTQPNVDELSENNRIYAENEGYENPDKLKQAIIDFVNCSNKLQNLQ